MKRSQRVKRAQASRHAIKHRYLQGARKRVVKEMARLFNTPDIPWFTLRL